MRADGMRSKPLKPKIINGAAQLELVYRARDSLFSSSFDAAKSKREKVTLEIAEAKLAMHVFEVSHFHLMQVQLRQSRGPHFVQCHSLTGDTSSVLCSGKAEIPGLGVKDARYHSHSVLSLLVRLTQGKLEVFRDISGPSVMPLLPAAISPVVVSITFLITSAFLPFRVFRVYANAQRWFIRILLRRTACFGSSSHLDRVRGELKMRIKEYV
mmetsp:Transcript_155/g.481  ORF Transcript_155/g.481 Transcript_155/m.481 type:complete len:212 (-) Transcript_155:509-1144(-)